MKNHFCTYLNYYLWHQAFFCCLLNLSCLATSSLRAALWSYALKSLSNYNSALPLSWIFQTHFLSLILSLSLSCLCTSQVLLALLTCQTLAICLWVFSLWTGTRTRALRWEPMCSHRYSANKSPQKPPSRNTQTAAHVMGL